MIRTLVHRIVILGAVWFVFLGVVAPASGFGQSAFSPTVIATPEPAEKPPASRDALPGERRLYDPSYYALKASQVGDWVEYETPGLMPAVEMQRIELIEKGTNTGRAMRRSYKFGKNTRNDTLEFQFDKPLVDLRAYDLQGAKVGTEGVTVGERKFICLVIEDVLGNKKYFSAAVPMHGLVQETAKNGSIIVRIKDFHWTNPPDPSKVMTPLGPADQVVGTTGFGPQATPGPGILPFPETAEQRQTWLASEPTSGLIPSYEHFSWVKSRPGDYTVYTTPLLQPQADRVRRELRSTDGKSFHYEEAKFKGDTEFGLHEEVQPLDEARQGANAQQLAAAGLEVTGYETRQVGSKSVRVQIVRDRLGSSWYFSNDIPLGGLVEKRDPRGQSVISLTAVGNEYKEARDRLISQGVISPASMSYTQEEAAGDEEWIESFSKEVADASPAPAYAAKRGLLEFGVWEPGSKASYQWTLENFRQVGQNQTYEEGVEVVGSETGEGGVEQRKIRREFAYPGQAPYSGEVVVNGDNLSAENWSLLDLGMENLQVPAGQFMARHLVMRPLKGVSRELNEGEITRVYDDAHQWEYWVTVVQGKEVVIQQTYELRTLFRTVLAAAPSEVLEAHKTHKVERKVLTKVEN